LAEYIQRKTDVEAKLIEGDHGVFDVVIDGELVHSRSKTGNFPVSRDIARLVLSRGA